MHQVLARIFEEAKHGVTDTRVEFGTLKSHAPVIIKLDEDPVPLEEAEIVLFAGTVYDPEDVGMRLALIRCTNQQYLVLGEVS